MSIHRIRLLGPWEAEVWSLNATGGHRLWNGRITPPCPFPNDEIGVEGIVCLNRLFHPPTNLTGEENLFLMLPGLSEVVVVTLNDAVLTSEGSSSADWRAGIYQPLQTNNNLAVTCQWNVGEDLNLPQLFQGAILEIHDSET